MKGKNSKAEKNKKDALRRVERAIAKYKESEIISELGAEAKQLSEKLEGITVADAKIYLCAKYQREKRKEKFVRARDTLLKSWTKLQTFAERYEQMQQPVKDTKKDKKRKGKDKDNFTNYANNIMKEWEV